MNKHNVLRKGLVCGIFLLFVGLGAMPMAGSLGIKKYVSTENTLTDCSMVSNTVSPDVTIILNGTMGENGWYVSCVTITFVYDPEVIAEVHYKIDIGSWQIYTEPFVICEDGLHTIYYYAVDMDGNQGLVQEAEFKIDTTPPVTEHMLDGLMGEEGWFVSDVEIKLVATDDMSGVNVTYYRLNNDDWKIYDGTSIYIEDGDGRYILEYYSVDNAGNIEDVKFCWFKIDQIIYYHDLIILHKGDDQVEFIANVIDKTSNIERVEFYIDDVLEYTDYEFPFKWNYFGERSQITLGSIVYDIAGNGAAWCIPISNNLETHGLGYPLQINEIENHFSGEMVLSDTSLFLNTGFSDVILYGTMGENGWYISCVTIMFDEDVVFRLDGGDWQVYTGPFTVCEDGWYLLEYYSEYEPVKYVTFKIDQTPPLIDPIVRDAGFYRWEIIACVYDETSNVNRVEFYVDNELVKEDGEFPFTYTYNGFQGNIKAIVYDKAGHSTENSSITSQSQNHISSQQSSSSSSDQSILPSFGSKIVEKSSMPTFYGNTLYVGGSGPGNYSSIQAAVNDADWGDTVFVYDDSSPYYENVIINKNAINLIGENKETTIIDGGGIDDVILIDGYADGVTISGFTIQNSGNEIWEDAGIDIHTEGNTITGNIIKNNSRCGVYCNSYPQFGWNIISENIVTNNWLGIFLDQSYNNEVYENYVAGNTGGISVGSSILPSKRGVSLLDEYYNNIYRNTITRNSGCGISMWVMWYTNVFENDITNNNYGIYLAAPYMTTCAYNNIYQNNITDNQKGLFITEGEDYAHVRNNKIYHNNFINNTQNAYDEGINQWDDGRVGNYWDDYEGIDILPPYGIGDTPYDIPPRLLFNRDRHPLMGPWPDPYNYNQASQNIQNNQQTSNQCPQSGSSGQSILSSSGTEYSTQECTLDIETLGPGTTDPVAGTYIFDYGTVVDIEACPNIIIEGRAFFMYWTGVPFGNETDNPVEITMDSDKTITANFWSYVVQPSMSGSGVVEVTLMSYFPYWVRLRAIAHPDWSFVCWSGSINSMDNPVDVVIEPGMHIIAEFARNVHDVGVKMITEPSGPPEPWSPGVYPVEAIVKNYGTFIENDFNVTARIWDNETVYYDDTVQISEINPDDEITVAFENVTFEDPLPLMTRGWYNTTYLLEITTELDNDENAENDRKTKNFTIEYYYTPQLIIDIEGDMGENGWFISEVIISMYVDDPYEDYSIMYRLDTGEWQEYIEPIIVSEDGEHILYVYTIDSEGNYGEEIFYGFRIDQTDPTIELTIEKIGSNTWLFIADVSDETSGINKVEFYYADELLGEVTEAPYEWLYSGSYGETATAIVYDNAGNYATSDPVPVSRSQSRSSNPQTPLFFQILGRLLNTR